MMNLTTAADEGKLRQNEISKDYHAYSLPKAARNEHAKAKEGVILRLVHFVASI